MEGVLQINPNEIPIKMYKTVHTGAKIQFGGLKKGFSRVTYQLFIEDWVAKLEIYPTAKQVKTVMIIFE